MNALPFTKQRHGVDGHSQQQLSPIHQVPINKLNKPQGPNAHAYKAQLERYSVQRSPLEQPNVEEQEENSGEKAQPDSPPDTSALRHAQHAVHIPAEPYAGTLERILEGVQVCSIANFVADGYRHLEHGEISTWPYNRDCLLSSQKARENSGNCLHLSASSL